MPDQKGNLYIHEAVALRNEYDNHIGLIKKLLLEPGEKKSGFLSRGEDEIKQPVEEFKQADFEDILKRLQTKRLKLNQEIQAANFTTKVDFEGGPISIAEALEVRKGVKTDIHLLSAKTAESAYNTVIHKEERDITDRPRHSFKKLYAEYLDALKRLRRLEGMIHIANHGNTVNFKDE